MIAAGFALLLTLTSQTAPAPAPTPAPSAPARAPAGAVLLTPEEAVRRALERSGSVRAAFLDADINAAEDALSLDPIELRLQHRKFDGLFGTPHTDNDGNPYAPLDDTYAALGWSPPKPSDLVEAFAAGDRHSADRFDAVTIERDFAANVLLLHAQARALHAEAELARSTIEVARQLEAKTREGLDASVTTSLDVHLTSLERLDAEADAQDVVGEALRAEHDLAGLVGLPVPLSLAPPARPLCAPPQTSIDQLVARARERSEKLAEHQARKSRAELLTGLGWTSWLPYVDAFQVGAINEPLGDRDTWRARVDIALPIFEPFAGESRVAGLELQRAEAMHAEELRQIDAQIRSAVNRLEGAVALVRVYEGSEKEIVDESLADVQRALDAGAIDVVQLAEVQRKAARGRRNLIRARFRCEEAAIELLRVTGDVTEDRQ